MKKYVLVLCFGFFYWGASAQNASMEAKLEKLRKQTAVPGVQIVHVKNGKIEQYNLGEQKYKSGIKVTSETIFQAASMSKVVAAYAFFRLYDRGVFDLDEPLQNYLVYPRLKDDPHAGEITARMVLNHTSGLPNWATGKPLRTAFKPGTAYRYSGEGFTYLQRVIEHLVQKPLEQILEEEVFKPLGMENSRYVYDPKIEPYYAYGHQGPDGLEATERRIFKKANAAYSMLTTASDYTIFVQKGLLEGQGLKPETLREMLTPSSSGRAANKSGEAYKHLHYGLGILLQENEVGKAIIHTGSNGGRYLTVFIAYPETKESLVIFTNSSNGLKFREKAAQLLLEPQTLWVFQR